MSEYEPELGQAIFGQPHKQFGCSALVTAALEEIAGELSRVMRNLRQRHYDSPFRNTGASFKCNTFEVHAYSWSDEEQPYNFKWRDVEIGWYKYLGRGMSANQNIPPDRVSEMLDDCIAALRQYEEVGGADEEGELP